MLTTLSEAYDILKGQGAKPEKTDVRLRCAIGKPKRKIREFAGKESEIYLDLLPQQHHPTAVQHQRSGRKHTRLATDKEEVMNGGANGVVAAGRPQMPWP